MKPTQNEISNYCTELEKYLYAQNWKIELTTLDAPIITSNFYEKEEDWFDDVKVTLPNGKEVIMFATYADINQIETDPKKIFCVAYSLQEKIYEFLKQKPNDSKYLKLWDKVN